MSTQKEVVAIPGETYAFAPFPEAAEEQGPLPRKTYIDQILKRLAAHASSEHNLFVEKTPSNTLSYTHIIDYFSGVCNIINIVRDGRDVITSMHPSAPNSYYISPERWLRDVRLGREAESYRQVLTVRYEDLVRQPTRTVRQICSHCDIPFDPLGIQEYPSTSQFSEDPAWFDKARAISDSSVNRWGKSEHKERIQELMSLDESVNLLKHYNYI
jgi:hypothetical protein